MQKSGVNPDASEGKAVPSSHKTPPYACHPYDQYVLDTLMKNLLNFENELIENRKS
jgi:hypothetical protein